MYYLSSEPGPNSYGSTSWETGNPSETIEGKSIIQGLIQKANSAPLDKLFKHYGVLLDEHNRAICPFKSHKGGRERSPSFNYYPNTNSYNCFGCANGGGVCNFVMEMEHCSKSQAADKIIKLFEFDLLDETCFIPNSNLNERLEIMLDFSNTVRMFRENNKTQQAFQYIETACQKYDTLNLKHKLDNEGLRSIVEQLKEYILLFQE